MEAARCIRKTLTHGEVILVLMVKCGYKSEHILLQTSISAGITDNQSVYITFTRNQRDVSALENKNLFHTQRERETEHKSRGVEPSEVNA